MKVVASIQIRRKMLRTKFISEFSKSLWILTIRLIISVIILSDLNANHVVVNSTQCNSPSAQSRSQYESMLGGAIVDGGIASVVNPFLDPPKYINVKSLTSDNLYQKPEVIIDEAGYVGETKKVTTEDGYRLKMFRILRRKGDGNKTGNGRPPVYIGHGLLSSAADWLMLSAPAKALPFRLVDDGFDVWLGNCRGNNYAMEHTKFKPNSDRFWNFSVHEMGTGDVPAIIEYISKETGFRKINYVGYSMSTTSFFICMSERPEYNERINKMVALAPAIYISNIRSPGKALALVPDGLHLAAHRELSGGQVLPWLVTQQLQRVSGVCDVVPGVSELTCQNLLHFAAGKNGNETNLKAIAKAENYSPSSASARTLIHFVQGFRQPLFQQYDWGRAMNQLLYGGAKEPPKYNLGRTKVDMLFMYGRKDDLTVVEDVEKTIEELKRNNPNIQKEIVEPFNHLDFVYGNSADSRVYRKISKFFSS